MTKINPKLLHVPSHLRDSRIGSTLSDNLREQYGSRSCRLVKGDSVRVLRGEYSGIEGKVDPTRESERRKCEGSDPFVKFDYNWTESG